MIIMTWKDGIKKEAADFSRGMEAAKRLAKNFGHASWFQVENDDEFMAKLQKRFDESYEKYGGQDINVRDLIRNINRLNGAFLHLTKEE